MTFRKLAVAMMGAAFLVVAWIPSGVAQLSGAQLITRSGFESNDGFYQIVFTTDQSALFSEIGQTAVFSAIVLDSSGQTFPTELTWELEPTAMVTGNAYEQSHPDELKLPDNIVDAAAALRRSAVARDLFGDDFVEHYAATRELEGREYHKHVTDWELQRYFEII